MWKWCLSSRRTTPTPAAVVPPPPKLAPRSFSSISAKKLSEGVLVSLISLASFGELTAASCCASCGVTPVPMRTSDGTLTPTPRSAAANRFAAYFGGLC
jgi:hypothetical protein